MSRAVRQKVLGVQTAGEKKRPIKATKSVPSPEREKKFKIQNSKFLSRLKLGSIALDFNSAV